MVRQDEHLPSKWRSDQGTWSRVIESLAALQLDRVTAARRMADIGSGAGFPGLVLASVLPDAAVTLIERKPERHRFLRRAIEALELSNVEVVVVPVQEWRAGLGACDVVTARNVAPLNIVVELAAPLLAIGGAAVLWGRRRRPTVEVDGEAAAAATGLHREQVREYERSRNLHVYEKVADTPSRFPRPGQAAFRDPLGADIDPEQWVPDDGAVSVSPLQRQVLELMADGESPARIAELLDLPYSTIKEQVRRVHRKLAAKTLDEALARARARGLLTG